MYLRLFIVIHVFLNVTIFKAGLVEPFNFYQIVDRFRRSSSSTNLFYTFKSSVNKLTEIDVASKRELKEEL